MAPYVEASEYWRDVLGTFTRLLLRSRLWWPSSVSEVSGRGLVRIRMDPLRRVRFRRICPSHRIA